MLDWKFFVLWWWSVAMLLLVLCLILLPLDEFLVAILVSLFWLIVARTSFLMWLLTGVQIRSADTSWVVHWRLIQVCFYMILMILASRLDLCTATKRWSAVAACCLRSSPVIISFIWFWWFWHQNLIYVQLLNRGVQYCMLSLEFSSYY